MTSSPLRPNLQKGALAVYPTHTPGSQPSTLIVFQFNPESMKRTIRTLGYVSHVDSDTIQRARAAGIDEVMARSAFSDKLGEILTSAREPGT